MTDTELDNGPEGEPSLDIETDEPTRHRRFGSSAIVIAALLVVTVASLAFALTAKAEADDASDESRRRSDAVLVASGFVEALLAYDFEDLDGQQAAVDRFASDTFRAEYDDAFTNDVRDQIVAEEASSSVAVEDVWLAVGDGDEVSAVVHARSTVVSGRGATAELESYLRVRLVRLDGQWKVDDLVSLGSRDLSAPLGPTGEPGGEDGG